MPEETAAPTETPKLLDLSAARIYTLDGAGGKKFTLHCRRIEADDWFQYFDGFYSIAEQKGQDRLSSFDATAAGLALVDRVLVKAEGYKTPGNVPLESLPNWKQLIPVQHRKALLNILTGVFSVSRTDLDVIYAEGEPVTLNAMWSQGETPGVDFHTDLMHVLAAPSQEQYTRFARANSRTMLMGGSRQGTTRYLGAHKALAKLYDELIVEVKGYSLSGVELVDINAVKREMDVLHKYAAARAIFEPVGIAFDTAEPATGEAAE